MSDSDDLDEKVESVRSILIDYIETSVDNQDYRRAENVQILVALGVLGGLVTLYVQDEIQGSSLQLSFWLIGGSSAAFLLLKTLITPLRFELKSRYLEEIDDRLLPFLYAFLILLSVLTGVTTLIARALPSIAIPEFRAVSAATNILLGLVASVVSYLYSKRYRQISKERHRLRQNILEQTEKIREKPIIDRALNNPKMLGDNIDVDTIEHHPPFGPVRIDLFAEDQSGTPVLAEVKAREVYHRDVDQLVSTIDTFRDRNDLDKLPHGALIAPLFSESALSQIKSLDHIQYVELDPSTYTDR